MPYTKEDYKREVARELFLKAASSDRHEWLDELPADKRLSGLPADKRLSGVSAEEIEAYLNELRKQVPPDGGASNRS